MEDNTRSKGQLSTRGNEALIFNLTPEMEIPAERAFRIIELTDTVEPPSEGRFELPQQEIEKPVDETEIVGSSLSTAPLEEPLWVADSPQADDTLVELIDIAQLAAPDTIALDDNLLLEDDTLVELTDIAQPAAPDTIALDDDLLLEDDTLVELTDIAQPAAPDMIALDDDLLLEDDTLVELTDIAQPAAPDMIALDDDLLLEDDTLVELTDIATPYDPELQDIVAESMADQPDEPPLDLNEWVVQTDPSFQMALDIEESSLAEVPSLPEPSRPIIPSAFPHIFEENDNVIRLEDVLNRGHDKSVPQLPPLDLSSPDEPKRFHDADDSAMFIGMALDDPITDSSGSPTQQEIETALERIIRTRYAQTIDQLIASAVEKVVTREMETIKRSLLEDEDPIQ